MKYIVFFIVSILVINGVVHQAAGGEQPSSYDEAYAIYRVKPYENDILAYYIEIPKSWTIGRVSDKNKELTTALKPLGLYSHVGEKANTLSQIQVVAAALGDDVTPLKFIQFYLHQISKGNTIDIHEITTIDSYRAMASLDWEVQKTPFKGEIFITLSNDRHRVFIVQALTNEKNAEEWGKECDYIFHSFQIINNTMPGK